MRCKEESYYDVPLQTLTILKAFFVFLQNQTRGQRSSPNWTNTHIVTLFDSLRIRSVQKHLTLNPKGLINTASDLWEWPTNPTQHNNREEGGHKAWHSFPACSWSFKNTSLPKPGPLACCRWCFCLVIAKTQCVFGMLCTGQYTQHIMQHLALNTNMCNVLQNTKRQIK